MISKKKNPFLFFSLHKADAQLNEIPSSDPMKGVGCLKQQDSGHGIRNPLRSCYNSPAKAAVKSNFFLQWDTTGNTLVLMLQHQLINDNVK